MIKLGDEWPLAVAPLPKENALQKVSPSNLPAKDHRNSMILANGPRPESEILWEKGSFVDLYI